MNLTNTTILITGGSSGLGLEMAAQLLALGNTVLITGRDQARLNDAKKRLPGLHLFQSDVSNPNAIAQLHEQVIRQFPNLNILINNAGEMRKINLNDPAVDLRDLTREIDINLTGPIRMIQQFLPHLKAQQSAAILNVTSGLALVPFPISPVYGATKAGLRSYTQSLRVQLKNSRVTVFELVAPAADTPLNNPFLNEDGFDPKTMMAPDKLVALTIKGLQTDTLTMYPGSANIIRIISRLAPKFLLSQTSKVGMKSMGG